MLSSEDNLTSHYRKLQRNDFRNANLYYLLISLIRGQSVLDIGCGSGVFLSLLKKRGKRVRGIETNSDLITLAKELEPEIPIERGTAADIDQYADYFDAITMVDVLEHIKDDYCQLEKIYHRLNNNGQLILVVPAFPGLFGRRDRLIGHYRRYTKNELINKLTSAGFKVSRLRYWNALGFIPYYLAEKIFRRELNVQLRGSSEKSKFQKLLIVGLNQWFRGVENKLDFGFGLSLICVAEKYIN